MQQTAATPERGKIRAMGVRHPKRLSTKIRRAILVIVVEKQGKAEKKTEKRKKN